MCSITNHFEILQAQLLLRNKKTVIFIFRTSRKFTTITPENLEKYFPGYFRNPKQQLEYERLILYGSKNKIPVTTQSVAPYNYHCNVDCRRRYGPFHNMRFKRQAPTNNDDFMHACCVTYVTL